MDVESIQKTFLKKISNFTITYAILMKLNINVYLNKVFRLAKYLGVTRTVSEGINKNPLEMIQKINFLAQFQP